ncbi:phosphatidate cytidylyltransferase [Hufsiella ginkgonis]|uniref:Phosphatidate cytidylyltransferase n=1 Tax=Hufsiella ginkgonis TaxID=2695274 RepID=A0A7K1XST1_9SPHI|nr:phosphatidate cytidylyltransferase [Hufsiella ginkgonis]MXV13970.1 phosphatidate cytidylyltransferase [Hufsiella ginkgonis]
MLNKSYTLVLLFAITLLSSCEVIGGIFKAGAYTAIFGMIILIGLIFWIFSKFRK